MIDAREEVLTQSVPQSRRRQTTVTVTRAGSTKPASAPTRKTLRVQRVFSDAKVNPFDQIEWDRRTAEITDDSGKVIFKQENVEVPKSWSVLATKVVVSKYFYGEQHTGERETSVRQLIHRITRTMADWGVKDGYFTKADGEVFYQELTWLCLNQHGAFNSPVWFNVGLHHEYGIGNKSAKGNWYYNRKTRQAERAATQYEYPQGSACFIQSVNDDMESIMRLAAAEAMLFKFGSGTGTNLSPIRSSKELLAGGGTASGPVSFMKGYDAFAGVIKSGGKTRRAAKMVILNADHPDIVDFINCKVEEEKKAWALIDAGYDGSFTGQAYGSVFFQNSNNSVRVTDDFMRAVLDDSTWDTKAVTNGDVVDTYRARDLMRNIAEGTHVCGDPGMQFDTTINEWHTCPETDRIHGSNPCSEYMFLNDSACNLASINLMKFVKADGEFDTVGYKACIRTLITAQEIIVDNASYPSAPIEKNSHAYRPLGLGYANLGALLMSRGLPYDSDTGRDYAAALTALMTGEAYAQSARIARDHGGPFSGYEKNREPFLRVMRKHRDSMRDVNARNVPTDLYAAAKTSWDDAVELGEQHGYRNAQATVLAPTGTIGFMMDCDTTGVEPDIALVKYKKLVGGGMMKIVNQTVPMALRKLGYTQPQVDAIIDYIDQNETIEGAPGLKDAHLAVFDCAFKAAKGQRSIHYMGHIKMMGATQPFISGAISKTVNVPKDATVEDIEQAYIQSWKIGAKAISIYRDGSKRTQPLNTSKSSPGDTVAQAAQSLVNQPIRRKLPDERQAITHKFDIQGHEGYITVGLFEDGQPGEIFLVMAKEGSTISGFADAFAQAISYALQYGVPLASLVDKFSHVRFEPSGMTRNPEIRFAKSIVDYIFRWLASKFLSPEAQFHAGVNGRDLDEIKATATATAPAPSVEAPAATAPSAAAATTATPFSTIQNQEDAPPCSTCGSIMIRSGACYKCVNCGNTSGCA